MMTMRLPGVEGEATRMTCPPGAGQTSRTVPPLALQRRLTLRTGTTGCRSLRGTSLARLPGVHPTLIPCPPWTCSKLHHLLPQGSLQDCVQSLPACISAAP